MAQRGSTRPDGSDNSNGLTVVPELIVVTSRAD